MNRRQFMAALTAGAVVTSTGLWMPGEKLISIPSGKVFTGSPFSIDANGNITVNGGTNEKHTVLELHRWLQDLADRIDGDYLDITCPTPSMRVTDSIIELQNGYNVVNPEYLCGGSLKNSNGDQWCGVQTVGQINDDTIVYINGKPALRPGHVDQCVKADTVILTTKTPGYTYSQFTIGKTFPGTNIGAVSEMRDLGYKL